MFKFSQTKTHAKKFKNHYKTTILKILLIVLFASFIYWSINVLNEILNYLNMY